MPRSSSPRRSSPRRSASRNSTPVPLLHAFTIEDRLRNLGLSRNRIANLSKKKTKCNKHTRKLRGERNKFLGNVNELLAEFNDVIGAGGQILV